MTIKQVSYRRIYNLGNYESATVEIIADVEKDESPETALDKLIERCKKWRETKAKGEI